MKNLKEYERNVYSQNGEDGVIKEILSRLSAGVDLDRWAVEFGAWDGVYLSNTCRLIREEGYSAVLIEGEQARVAQLHRNFPQDNVFKLCRFVGFEGASTLDRILSETPVPLDFDVLSIDVDGVDYHIFDSLKSFSPKVVCIEFNPSIPNAVDFVQAKRFDIKQGSSARALFRLAREKGYCLVYATSSNLFFVRETLRPLVLDQEERLENLHPIGNDPTYLFVGYDGTLLSNKSQFNVWWHGVDLEFSRLQPLPRFLRKFPGDYGFFRRFMFYLWRAVTEPALMYGRVRRRKAPKI